jgi:hypothetical protein
MGICAISDDPGSPGIQTLRPSSPAGATAMTCGELLIRTNGARNPAAAASPSGSCGLARKKSAEPGHGALLGLIDLSKLLIYINGLCGTAGGIRTTDLLIHSQAL